MSKRKLYAAGGVLVALFAFGGIAAAAGVGPSLADAVQKLISSPESKVAVVDQRTGCGSATSTDCATIRTSQPAEQPAEERSTATSYTEVASTKQSGKIDDHLTVDNTLKDISFCGDLKLRTRQILVNGMDVGQRIAQLASDDQMGKLPNGDSIGQGMCNSMPHNISYTKGILQMPDVTTFKSEDSRDTGENYKVVVGTEAFTVNPATNEIFSISAYDGSTLTAVGNLK
ncbi:hypothetical protein H0X32_01370 [Patescibacteria group bacterium]|nr:hypothetical protein [Patescibacteria group bacterium]